MSIYDHTHRLSLKSLRHLQDAVNSWDQLADACCTENKTSESITIGMSLIATATDPACMHGNGHTHNSVLPLNTSTAVHRSDKAGQDPSNCRNWYWWCAGRRYQQLQVYLQQQAGCLQHLTTHQVVILSQRGSQAVDHLQGWGS